MVTRVNEKFLELNYNGNVININYMGLINSFLSFHGSQELPKHREERKATTL
jgi:hypothetical protein